MCDRLAADEAPARGLSERRVRGLRNVEPITDLMAVSSVVASRYRGDYRPARSPLTMDAYAMLILR